MAAAAITGATGFVGSHLARALLDAGHSVRVLRRASSRLDGLTGLDVQTALGDVLDAESLVAAFVGCDWVFHVAAVADYWRANRDWMFAVNVEGTRRVLWAARKAGVQRVVFTSSAAAVGLRPGIPSDETVPFNFAPRAFPYGYSKVLAEAEVQAAIREFAQDVVIVNPVVILGPGDLNQISGTFITQIKRFGWAATVTSGGAAVTDVRDVARWHLAAAEHGRMGERYVLGTSNFAYSDLFKAIAQVVGTAAPRIFVPDFALPIAATLIDLARRAGLNTPVDANQARLGDKDVYFDFTKAWRELGEPRIDMLTSIRDTYTWYAEHGYITPDATSRALERVAKRMGWM